MEKVWEIPMGTQKLFGIEHIPNKNVEPQTAVLMLVGGPQNRLGSHRSYVQIARGLAKAGYRVFRFDYAGLGDSAGEFIGFEGTAASLKSALDHLNNAFPELKNICLWALCDGAAASAIYAPADRERISSMILCNPYVHTEMGQAKAILKYYYISRFFQRDFWMKLLGFKFNVLDSLKDFFKLLGKGKAAESSEPATSCDPQNPVQKYEGPQLPSLVINGLIQFKKPVQFILSTADLTAKEFEEALKKFPAITSYFNTGLFLKTPVQGSDHTFSQMIYKEDVIKKTTAALKAFTGTAEWIK